MGDPATAGLVVAWLADLDGLTGALAAAWNRADNFIADATATGGHMGLGPAVLARTTLLLGGGDADGARAFAAALEPGSSRSRSCAVGR